MEPDTKIDAPVQVPAKPRGRWRRIARRTLKYSLIVFLILTVGLTAFAWTQSSKTFYRLTMALNASDRILLSSYRQRIHFGVFNCSTPSNSFIVTETVRIRSSAAEFPRTLMAILPPWPTKLGIGIVTKINHYSSPTVVATFKGHGVLIPYWFVLLVLGSILMFVLMKRFSLRAFLIWVTIVCVILGIAMRSGGDSNAEKEQGGQHGK
jgi:hypothetical protein